MKELINIQHSLKAPKGQYNSFGKYNYRSCEDILEAVKPLLNDNGCFLTLSDEVLSVGNRIYVRTIATITNSAGEKVTTTALAREDETKKGMDGSQITGAASSYARKYALNGLFCIDDTKDADTNEQRKQAESTPTIDDGLALALDEVKRATTRNEVKEINSRWLAYQSNEVFRAACNNKFKSLSE